MIAVQQLNINGTSKAALIDDHVNAAAAIRAAIQALRKTEPHGRDWQGPPYLAVDGYGHIIPNPGFKQAQYEHLVRMTHLEKVLNEIEALTLAIDAQPDPRKLPEMRLIASSETTRDLGVPLGGVLENTYLPSPKLSALGTRMVWVFTARSGTVTIFGNERQQWIADKDTASDDALRCLNQNRDNWAWWRQRSFQPEEMYPGSTLPIYEGAP